MGKPTCECALYHRPIGPFSIVVIRESGLTIIELELELVGLHVYSTQLNSTDHLKVATRGKKLIAYIYPRFLNIQSI